MREDSGGKYHNNYQPRVDTVDVRYQYWHSSSSFFQNKMLKLIHCYYCYFIIIITLTI